MISQCHPQQSVKDKEGRQDLENHLNGLLTYFSHRITNDLTEEFNSKIQSIKADARGFQNFENYRTRILFFRGKFDLLPNLNPASSQTIP